MRRVALTVFAVWVLATAAPALAARYQAVVQFAGSYDAVTLASDGQPAFQLHAHALLRGIWPVTVVSDGTRTVGYPSTGAVRYSLAARGSRRRCGVDQTFEDRVVGRPGLAWLTVGGSGALARLDYRWAGDRIDRVFAHVASAYGSCDAPAVSLAGAGAGDLPGTAAFAHGLGLSLLLPTAGFRAGRTVELRLPATRRWHRGRTTRILRGRWTVTFSPVG
jgi:hypothetical protein